VKCPKDYFTGGGELIMSFSIASINPVVSILFGVLILVFPKSLNYLIAAYLIISGLLALGIIR